MVATLVGDGEGLAAAVRRLASRPPIAPGVSLDGTRTSEGSKSFLQAKHSIEWFLCQQLVQTGAPLSGLKRTRSAGSAPLQSLHTQQLRARQRRGGSGRAAAAYPLCQLLEPTTMRPPGTSLIFLAHALHTSSSRNVCTGSVALLAAVSHARRRAHAGGDCGGGAGKGTEMRGI